MGRVMSCHQLEIACISIHPSRVGWDWASSGRGQSGLNFNPPIPCGMGQGTTTASMEVGDISIHPSRVGWDCHVSKLPPYAAHFNPPIPCGMGHLTVSWNPVCGKHFNPPIPCGMGPGVLVHLRKAALISIHPSRVGWDYLYTPLATHSGYFNPPIPCGMGPARRGSIIRRT